MENQVLGCPNHFLVPFSCSTHGYIILVEYEVVWMSLNGSTNKKVVQTLIFHALAPPVGLYGLGFRTPPTFRTLDRPSEKTRRSCQKPLKMSNIIPPKYKHTNFQVPGLPQRYRTTRLNPCKVFVENVSFARKLH